MITTDKQARKEAPVTTGVLDYFPLALIEVARLSKAGNDQHNPGETLHWARGKSTDHADCITRHLIERGTIDTDGISHTAKVAWRALALLQEEMEDKLAAETGRPKSDFGGLSSRWPDTESKQTATAAMIPVQDPEGIIVEDCT